MNISLVVICFSNAYLVKGHFLPYICLQTLLMEALFLDKDRKKCNDTLYISLQLER